VTDTKPRASDEAGLLNTVERIGRLIENLALVVILSGMILLASGQILLRNVFSGGFAWADEALRLMVLWVAMLGAVVASREDRHISIDVLARVLPDVIKRWTIALVNAFTAAVSFTLAWFSWEFVAESRLYEDQLLNDLPAWLFQSILPVAFFLIGYRYSIWFLRRARLLLSGVEG
jgi:TRAP-type C4-dicarboxylate transport system permease small subunit